MKIMGKSWKLPINKISILITGSRGTVTGLSKADRAIESISWLGYNSQTYIAL